MRHFPVVVALLLASSAAIAVPTSGGIDIAGLDTATRPGDDFEQFANGGWRATAEIPADRSSTGVGYDVFRRAEGRNAALIRDAAAAKPTPGTSQRRIADYYAAFNDTAGIEARGLAPLKPALAEIAALKTKRDLSALLGASMRADTDPLNATSLSTKNLFGLWVTQDLAHPERTVPYLMQGGLGMPDRDYYLSKTPDMLALQVAYRAYVEQMFSLAGISDSKARATRVVALETRIAQAHADIIASQDPHGAVPWRRADFAAKAPGIDWTAFWAAASLPKQQQFTAWQPAAITGLAALVGSVPMQDWQDWLTFHRLNHAASVLPKAFDDASFGFNGTALNGTPVKRARDRRAIAAVNAGLGDDVGQIFAAQYFPATSRTQIEAMVKNILAAFDTRLAALDWINPLSWPILKLKLRLKRRDSQRNIWFQP